MAYVDLAQDPATMQRIFVALGLAGPGEAVQATPLPGGVSSGIYQVRLQSGSYCVKQPLPQLKVAKEWKVPVERVFHEIDWLKTVGGIVPGHVPRVYGHDEASKSFVMEFLGPRYRNWKAELLAGHVQAGDAAAVGDILGRIHAETADQPELAARFDTSENFHAIRLEPYLVEAARVHPGLAAGLLATVERTARTRRVLVHGDVSPKNVLLGPEGPMLLDAECAWFGDPAFDVAFCLNHFLLKTAHLPACAAALLTAFRAFRAAYRAHIAWEPVDELERRVAWLLPGLALARVDGKSPVEYLSEQQRVRVRHCSTRLLTDPPASVDAVADAWTREFAA